MNEQDDGNPRPSYVQFEAQHISQAEIERREHLALLAFEGVAELNAVSSVGHCRLSSFGLLLMLVRMSPQIQQSRYPENFPAFGFLAKQIFRLDGLLRSTSALRVQSLHYRHAFERSSQPR